MNEVNSSPGDIVLAGAKDAAAAVESLNVQQRDVALSSETEAGTSSSLEQRIARLQEQTEVELIRRDPRLLPVLMNFFRHFRPWRGRHDARSNAALQAFLWRILSPGTGALAVGGVVTVLLAAGQLVLLQQQNELVDQQSQLMHASSAISLTPQVGSLVQKIDEFARNVCVDPKVWKQLVAEKVSPPGGMKRCWNAVDPDMRSTWIACARSVKECKAAIEAPPNPFRQSWPELPPDLRAEVAALTTALQPYRVVDTTGIVTGENNIGVAENWLTGIGKEMKRLARQIFGDPADRTRLYPSPISPQRGLIFTTLLQQGFTRYPNSLRGADFSRSYSVGSDLTNALVTVDLNEAVLIGADWTGAAFRNVKVRESDFTCSSLMSASMEGSTIIGGLFDGVTFLHTRLPRAEDFSPRSMRGASLHDAIVREADWLSKIAAKKIPGFDELQWTLRAIDVSTGVFKVEGSGKRGPSIAECLRLRGTEKPR